MALAGYWLKWYGKPLYGGYCNSVYWGCRLENVWYNHVVRIYWMNVMFNPEDGANWLKCMLQPCR